MSRAAPALSLRAICRQQRNGEIHDALFRHLDALEDIKSDLDFLSNGLDLLSRMLESGQAAGIQPGVGKALYGLLHPIVAGLERHTTTLHGALNGKEDSD